MRSIFCVFLSLMIAGCSVFKNGTKSREEQELMMKNQSSFSSTEQKDWLKKTGSIWFFRDSADANYSVQVWPRGVFSYSVENGFKGEAEKVVIAGNSSNVSTAAFSQNVKEHDQGNVTLKQQNEERLDIKGVHQTSSQSVSWKVTIGFVIGLAMIGWWIFRKLNQ